MVPTSSLSVAELVEAEALVLFRALREEDLWLLLEEKGVPNPVLVSQFQPRKGPTPHRPHNPPPVLSLPQGPQLHSRSEGARRKKRKN